MTASRSGALTFSREQLQGLLADVPAPQLRDALGRHFCKACTMTLVAGRLQPDGVAFPAEVLKVLLDLELESPTARARLVGTLVDRVGVEDVSELYRVARSLERGHRVGSSRDGFTAEAIERLYEGTSTARLFDAMHEEHGEEGALALYAHLRGGIARLAREQVPRDLDALRGQLDDLGWSRLDLSVARAIVDYLGQETAVRLYLDGIRD